jgi:hypothetical protein
LATIDLGAKQYPLALQLYFGKLRVAVDGNVQELKWGRHQIDVSPGPHQIEFSFRYFGMRQGQAATIVTATQAPAIAQQSSTGCRTPSGPSRDRILTRS